MIRSKKPQKEKPTEFAHQSAFVKNQDKYVKSKLLSEKYQTKLGKMELFIWPI